MTLQPAGGRATEFHGPRPGSWEDRASLVFKILAAVNGAAIVLAMFPPPTPSSALQAASWAVAAGAMAILYVVEARGIARGRAWARSAARPLLVVVIASGIAATLIAFDAGRTRLPFEAVLGIWAWLGGPDVARAPERGVRGILLVGAAVPLLAVVLVGHLVFGWGGLLDVHEPDLRASLAAECGPPGPGLPAAITVTYDWSWATTSPFPSGLDVVVIGWTGDDAEGRPLYLLDATPPSGGGVREGLQADPSLALALEAEGESKGSWHWGIELGDQQLAPGHIEARLALARDAPPRPGPLTIRASYVHLGLWRHDAVSVTCSW